MKKIVSILLALALIFSFSACGKKEEAKTVYATFDVGDYQVELPASYEPSSLDAVRAESDCVAMLTDKDGKYPDLWVYVDNLGGETLKEHIINLDATWDFIEMAVYIKDEKTLARTEFDENWYGNILINEVYYELKDDNQVLSFDFAYEEKKDHSVMHSYIEEITEHLGF